MKSLKIFIQKPWKSSDSPYYKFLKEQPPENVEYVNLGASNLFQNKRSMKLNDLLKQFIKRTIRKIYSSMPNAHYTQDAKRYDLIHCAHCLSKNKYPWICNIEYVGQFWASGGPPRLSQKKHILKILKSKYCKGIIAWTEWAKRDIVKYFPEIENKVEVIYPGIHRQKFKKNTSDKIRLLFVSRKFYFKGGLYAIEVMDRLTKKYENIEATIVSDIPEEIVYKYSSNKKIKLLGMMPQEKLFKEIYPAADIFVYPSFCDTFGFPITEAMSFGLPVVGSDRNSRRELIEEMKTGFLAKTSFSDKMLPYYLENINKSLLDELIDKTDKIIKDKKMRDEMSKECIKLFEKGEKFSIETRNKRLKEVYTMSLMGEDEK